MIDTVMFDLDGTLLWMDEKQFIKRYFDALVTKFQKEGFHLPNLLDMVWSGVDAMIHNDGVKTNETVFWDRFLKLSRLDKAVVDPLFRHFYHNEFIQARTATRAFPAANRLIPDLRAAGYRLILATNPIFPENATFERIHWAGLKPLDFSWITTMENSSHAKPNPEYYYAILNRFALVPEQCMMVGNDEKEDMIAGQIGLKTFLVTDCLIERTDERYSADDQGDFSRLDASLRQLPGMESCRG